MELTPKGNRVHHTTDEKPIAIANDYFSGDLREEFGLPAKTIKPHLKGQPGEHRRNTMLRELNRRKPQSLSAALKAIQVDWIENKSTVQQMAFCPASGECIVYGLEEADPVAAGYIPA